MTLLATTTRTVGHTATGSPIILTVTAADKRRMLGWPTTETKEQ